MPLKDIRFMVRAESASEAIDKVYMYGHSVWEYVKSDIIVRDINLLYIYEQSDVLEIT